MVGALIGLQVPGWWVLIPVQGVLITFLFTLEHEATHRTPFGPPALNDWVGRACGMVLVLPFEWFRYFHLAHHRHTNLPGLDPAWPVAVVTATPESGAAPLEVQFSSAGSSDPDGTIASVEFIVNGVVLGTDTTFPYSATWAPTAPGTYSLTAIATDSVGIQATSSAQTITSPIRLRIASS